MPKKQINWTLIILIVVGIMFMTGFNPLKGFMGATVCTSNEPTTLDGLANGIAGLTGPIGCTGTVTVSSETEGIGKTVLWCDDIDLFTNIYDIQLIKNMYSGKASIISSHLETAQDYIDNIYNNEPTKFVDVLDMWGETTPIPNSPGAYFFTNDRLNYSDQIFIGSQMTEEKLEKELEKWGFNIIMYNGVKIYSFVDNVQKYTWLTKRYFYVFNTCEEILNKMSYPDLDKWCTDDQQFLILSYPEVKDVYMDEFIICQEEPECTSNSDCVSPKICSSGQCSYQCITPSDCPSGQSCTNNICKSKGGWGCSK